MLGVLSTESPTRVALGLPSYTVLAPWAKWNVRQVVLLALDLCWLAGVSQASLLLKLLLRIILAIALDLWLLILSAILAFRMLSLCVPGYWRQFVANPRTNSHFAFIMFSNLWK